MIKLKYFHRPRTSRPRLPKLTSPKRMQHKPRVRNSDRQRTPSTPHRTPITATSVFISLALIGSLAAIYLLVFFTIASEFAQATANMSGDAILHTLAR